jgi:hypothetical protein
MRKHSRGQYGGEIRMRKLETRHEAQLRGVVTIEAERGCVLWTSRSWFEREDRRPASLVDCGFPVLRLVLTHTAALRSAAGTTGSSRTLHYKPPRRESSHIAG